MDVGKSAASVASVLCLPANGRKWYDTWLQWRAVGVAAAGKVWGLALDILA